MTPEEAQEKTEKKWRAIAAGEDILPTSECGWCRFAEEIAGTTRPVCPFCPAFRTHEGCMGLSVMSDFCAAYNLEEPWTEEARAVYEFLRQMGPQYIEVAHEILLEESRI